MSTSDLVGYYIDISVLVQPSKSLSGSLDVLGWQIPFSAVSLRHLSPIKLHTYAAILYDTN